MNRFKEAGPRQMRKTTCVIAVCLVSGQRSQRLVGLPALDADHRQATANAPPALPSGERAARLIANKTELKSEKQEKRDARERETAEKIIALPDKKYGVILADPEWRFEPWS